MIIEQMKMMAAHGKRKELGSALSTLVGPTQVQPGCLSCRLSQNWQDPDELLIEANWETYQDLIHHLQSEPYMKLLQMMEASCVPPILQFWTVQEVQGIELVEVARASPI